jgi:peptidoglycan/LPS O-acetylase OafA/YrhL
MTSRPSHAASDRSNFDLLRLLFAGLVIFSHSFELIGLPDPVGARLGMTSLGQLAVDGFFLISGYLITQSWLADPSVKRFLAKRVLRIYPAFIVASILSVFVAGPLGAVPHQYFAELDIARVVRGLMLLQIPPTPRVFAGTSVPLANGAVWTISFEFRCYLIAMLLGLLGLFRWRYALLALTIVLGLSVCWMAPPSGATDSQHLLFGLKALRISDFMAWFATLFLTGSCYALFRDRIRFTPVLWLAALAVLVFSLAHPGSLRPGLLLAGAYVVFGIAAAPAPSNALGSLRRTDISYGLYLYGWPVQKLLTWYFPSLSAWPTFALTLMIAGTLAFASWHFIEKPALRIKPRVRVADSEMESPPTAERVEVL